MCRDRAPRSERVKHAASIQKVRSVKNVRCSTLNQLKPGDRKIAGRFFENTGERVTAYRPPPTAHCQLNFPSPAPAQRVRSTPNSFSHTWIQRIELKGVSFGNDELQKPLIEGSARPSIAQATDYLFNDPRSPWSNVFAEGNGFWFPQFWRTPLPDTGGFRKQALRGLGDQTLAGTITFNPPEEWRSRGEAEIEMKGLGMGYGGSNGDPDMPPPGQKRSFRIRDLYAYFYSQYHSGPKFQLFWPQTKRDAGVLACRKWLEAKNKGQERKCSTKYSNNKGYAKANIQSASLIPACGILRIGSVEDNRMRRPVARKISYRVVAVVCFALGAGSYFWFGQKESESRILVEALPPPPAQTLIEARQITLEYEFGGFVDACAPFNLDSSNLTRADRLKDANCRLERENARKFLLRNWQEQRKSYIEIAYPCVDCSPVYDVLIEQNNHSEWQITVRREPDRWFAGSESVAVALKRRRATEDDRRGSSAGESILVFVDAIGHEILTL